MIKSLVEATADNPARSRDAQYAGTDGRANLRRLIQSFSGRPDEVDRRRDLRYPYTQPITLYPVNPDYSPCEGGPLLVVGRNISESGLSFYHTSPLPYRQVIADLEMPDGARLAVLMDLTWCRFTQNGRYENGGRFLQIVDVGDAGKNGATGECDLDFSEPRY